ncbi:MAG TPA: hypothetical protein VKH45_14375 [Candidatus Acidoferrum sp.]|nr:hypothetical protein [Candidatus Acidoferrum sp.]
MKILAETTREQGHGREAQRKEEKRCQPIAGSEKVLASKSQGHGGSKPESKAVGKQATV